MPAQIAACQQDSRPPASLGPEPILAAVEAYTGSILDLDRSTTVGPAEFAQQWKQLARAMRERGLQRGDRLVMAIANGPLFLAALAAVLAEGGTPLLLHSETPVAELKRSALQIGARFLLTGRFDEQSQASAGLRASVLGNGAAWTQAAWAAVDDAAPAFPEPRYLLSGVPLHPTSGSTGRPKIAVRPGFCAMEEARHYVETLGIDRHDSVLAVAPMSHAYAYGMCAMVPLLAGANLVTMERFDPGRAARALAELPITVFPAVPLVLDMLLAATDGKLQSAPRCVLSAGSPLSERTAHEFHKRSGTVVRSLYGTTETGGISIAKRDETEPGCVGPPMDGVAVDIRPEEHALAWDKGVGRVHVKSSSMMAGYLGDDGIDDAPLAGGWFATGDVGRLDERGAIHLVGRETDVINVCGMKVVPREVEEVLLALDGVREAKVYAGRRGNGTDYVKAAMVAPDLDVSCVRAHCARHLVYYKRPEVITLLDALPKSSSGKVLRDRLP